MDSAEDYFYSVKNRKQQKYEGCSKRKGNTVRRTAKTGIGGGDGVTQEVVTKFITPSENWNRKRINDFCSNVLNDGGILHCCDDSRRRTPETIPQNTRKAIFGPMQTYSMKKHKRWELSGALKRAIYTQVANKDTESPNLVVVERLVGPACNQHFTGRPGRPDVISATYSAMNKPRNPLKPRNEIENERYAITRECSSAYSYTTEMLGLSTKPDDGLSKRQRRRNARRDEPINNERAMPEVMYEFSYACPKDQYPFGTSNNYKFLKFPTDRPWHRKMGKHEHITEYEDNFSDVIMDDLECEFGDERSRSFKSPETKSENDDGLTAASPLDTEFSLLSYVKTPTGGKRKKSKRAPVKSEGTEPKQPIKSLNPKPEKGRVFKAESTFESDVTLISRHFDDETNEMKKDFVYVDHEAQKYEVKFNRKYLEAFTSSCHDTTALDKSLRFAKTSPARFAVDLKQSREPGEGVGAHCYMIFTTDVDEGSIEENDRDLSRVFVSIICNDTALSNRLNEDLLACCTEMKENVLDIEEFVEKVRNITASTSESNVSVNIPAKNKSSSVYMLRERKASRMASILRGLSKTTGQEVKYYTRDEAIEEIIATKHTVECRNAESEDDFVYVVEPSYPRNCGSCNTTLSKNDNPGLSLQGCRHWFCEPCWLKHLTRRIQFYDGASFKCPDQGCCEVLDDVTMLCILPTETYQEYRRKLLEYEVKIGNFHNCPSPSCTRLTKIAGNENEARPNLTMMTCKCDTTWCGVCGKDAHWPASCHVAEMYDSEQAIASNKIICKVVGKCCPRCSIFTEKIGGCNNVMCSCGCKYCWNCLSVGIGDHECVHVELEEFVIPAIIDGQALDPKKAVNNQIIAQPHQLELLSGEKRYRARIRALCFLEGLQETAVHQTEVLNRLCEKFGYGKQVEESVKDGDSKRQMMAAVEEALLLCDQIHVIIPYARSVEVYGNLTKQKNKRVKDLIRKIEVLCWKLEWILLTRDYKSRDTPDLFRKHITTGKNFIRSLHMEVK